MSALPLSFVVRRPQRLACRGLLRSLSRLSQVEKDGVSSWVKAYTLPVKQSHSRDHVSPSRIEALCCTLPSLDGTIPSSPRRSPESLINQGSRLSPGHHLIFCNPSVPERHLNADATSSFLLPPAPLTRRMWSGGRFEFKRPIRIGDNIVAEPSVSKIEVKRLDSENPMIVVEQTIETKIVNNDAHTSAASDPGSGCITELRSHVYLPVDNERRIRIVKDLPKPDFSLSYTPTDTMLFRFSALTFNAHRVHLYKEYAQNMEKLPERLVHGPMTALMLLETVEHYKPEHSVVHEFIYKATNPLFVDRRITIYGGWLLKDEVKLWAQSDDGVVGMIGEVRLKHSL